MSKATRALRLPDAPGKAALEEENYPVRIAIETRGGTVCGVYCSAPYAEITLYDFDNFELPKNIMAAMEEALKEDIEQLHTVPYYRAEHEFLEE